MPQQRRVNMTPFRDEEVKVLKESRYIENVLPEEIIYSEEFDHEYHRLRNEGKEPDEIFETLGLNIDIIGKKGIKEYNSVYEERIKTNPDYYTALNDTTISGELKRFDRALDSLVQDKKKQ